jgi:hypothetical protein
LAGSNRLSSSSGSETKTYAYTAAGDLQQQSGAGGQFTWSYGGNGRISTLLKPNEPAYTYRINALGERTFKPGT